MTSLGEIVAWTVLWAGLSALLVFVTGTGVAYALARSDIPGRRLLLALLNLPLVLPPTAVGYLLLRIFSDNGILGVDTLGIDLDILFTWKGIVIAYFVMSFPLFIRTARISFETVNPRLEEISRTLGWGPWQTFFRVTFPLAGRGLLAGVILSFTRAIGEFGATVTVAANIPGKTQTLASAIYSSQQSGNEARATALLITAFVLGFSLVYLSEWLSASMGSGPAHATRPSSRET